MFVKSLTIIVLTATIACSGAQAAALFSTDFTATGLGANLTTAGPANFGGGQAGTGVYAGQTVLRQLDGSSSESVRTYVQTLDTNYNTIDFKFRLAFSELASGSGDDFIFLGLGKPAPFGASNEPGTGVFMRIHTGNFVGVNNLASRNLGTSVASSSGPNIGGGAHVAQIEKTGSLLSFSVDILNNGTFVPFGSTVDLSSPTYSFLNATNSQLFFGTGSFRPEFNSLSVTSDTAVPEPASLSVLGLGMLGAIAARRARRKSVAAA